MKTFLAILLLVAVLAALPQEAIGRDIKAYYNGQEATVTGVVLRPGEPFTIDLNITPDEEADVWAELDEPGEPRAYDRLDGDLLTPGAFKPCNASYGACFHWVLAAGGGWTGGTAPLNIYYQINARNSNKVIARGYFTVVEAYIDPADSTPAENNVTGTDDKGTGRTPGPGVATCLACIMIALLIRRRSS